MKTSIFHGFVQRCLTACLPALLVVATAGCDTGVTPNLPNASNNNPNTPTVATPSGTTHAIAASKYEQLALERINRARLLPSEEATRFGITVDEGVPGQINASPKPAVAMNSTLRQVALDHANDMLRRNYFAHNSPEGLTPFQRINNGGYLYSAAGENLAWRGSTGVIDATATVDRQHQDLFVDADIEGRGHRMTLLNPDLREVGVGIVRGSFTRQSDGVVFADSLMQTQDYGASQSGNTFVLGVVYRDTNNNGQYDYDEGVAQSLVRLGGVSKLTNAAGGYSFEISQPGAYTIRFAAGSSQTLQIAENGPNIKVDLIDETNIVLNLGVGSLN